MITFRGAIDHAAQQYNLFHLASLFTPQIICRGTILVKQKMWLNVLKIYGWNSDPR